MELISSSAVLPPVNDGSSLLSPSSPSIGIVVILIVIIIIVIIIIIIVISGMICLDMRFS